MAEICVFRVRRWRWPQFPECLEAWAPSDRWAIAEIGMFFLLRWWNQWILLVTPRLNEAKNTDVSGTPWMIFRFVADSLPNGLLWFWWSNIPRPSKLLWRQTAQQHLSQDRSYPWPWHAMATRLRFGYAFVGFLMVFCWRNCHLNILISSGFDLTNLTIWHNLTLNCPPWKQSLFMFIRLFAASKWEDAQCLPRESGDSDEYRKGDAPPGRVGIQTGTLHNAWKTLEKLGKGW